MCGEQVEQLEFCGYDMKLKRFTIKNACALEYHVEMFNKKRWNGWTIERLMKELGMNSVDEGVTLKMLIPIYKKYRIPYHCVDFKYHITSSSNKHDYKANCNYATLFYMI